jgi:PucR family transcriptional regulator, purine catabolism regulatory protein
MVAEGVRPAGAPRPVTGGPDGGATGAGMTSGGAPDGGSPRGGNPGGGAPGGGGPGGGAAVASTVTVAELLAMPELRLRVLAGGRTGTPVPGPRRADRGGTAGGDPGARRIYWAHVSELADPTEFLRGGELVLLTGVNLPAGADAQRAYVTRLAEAGVSAIGFGVGVQWDEVPAPLLEAADATGLPLLEVPRAVPFLAITRAVATEIARQDQAAEDRLARAQRSLTAAAVGRGGQVRVAPLLDELVRLTGGWALVLNRAGALLAASPSTPETTARRDGLGADLTRLRDARGPASLVAGAGERQVWVQSLHAGHELLGFLAVGGALGPVERQIVNAAVPLGVLLLDRAGALGRGARRLRSGVLRLLLAGQLELVGEVAGELWNGMPAEPLVALVGQGGRNALLTARERLAADRAVAATQVVHGELDEELVCLCAADPAAPGSSPNSAAHKAAGGGERAGSARSTGTDLAAVLHALRGIDGLRIGLSDPAGTGELTRAVTEARQAAELGGATGRVSWFRDLPRPGLLELLPGPSAAEFAASVLRPLRAAGGGRGDLVQSLRVWLAHHGQWDPAAAELGVHRHTLRNRVRKAERILDRELDSPDVRAELWLALRLDEQAGH